MERSIEIRTPESIAFSYDLAGLGSRFLAVIIDLVIQALIVIGFFIGMAMLAAHATKSHLAASNEHFFQSLGVAIVSVFFFMVLYGYFILFEAFWRGQTPGKKLLGIRVVRDGGYPLDFMSAVIRNIVRIGEQLLGFYVIAAISSLISNENKRIGDYAAGTIVVRENRTNYV